MSVRVIFANDLPYVSTEADPLRALSDTLALSADDWATSRAMAWVWGIVLGWDADDDPEEDGAMDTLALRFGWSPNQVAHLRELHARFVALTEATS